MSAHRSPAIGLMLTLGIVLGCSSEAGAPSGPTSAPVASVTVAPAQGQILVGGTIQYAATLKDAADATLTGRTVTWSSSDNSVATVEAGGMVTGVGSGAATITATAEGKQGNASVAVVVPVATVTVSPATVQLAYKGSAQLTATVQDAQGNTLTDRTVRWNSSDFGVARVLADGSVTGAGPGSATITATVEGVQGAADVTVAPLVLTSIAGGGESHQCALTSDGTAYCWGENFYGQLGVAGPAQATPTPVGTDLRFVQLVAGDNHTCGLTANGAAYCWGRNTRGQLGNGTTTPAGQPGNIAPAPVNGGLSFSSLTAGTDHICGLASGSVYCWGYNWYGQLATGDTLQRLVPTPITGDPGLVSVFSGKLHACGLTAVGAAYCWGWNWLGQLGNGTRDPTNSSTDPRTTTPTAVSGGLTFSELSPGTHMTCALTTGGTAYCWGWNPAGQLGVPLAATTDLCPTPDRPCSLTPVAVSGGLQFGVLSAGRSHVCGRTSSGAVYCWGGNGYGQLGDGSLSNRFGPTPVAGQFTFASLGIGSGRSHSCGIATDGKTYCWGRNFEGQLGDGSRTNRSTPTLVRGQQ